MANRKDTTVKYVNKDFEGFKLDLMRYAQAHFSGSYQDFNESSPGMMMLELQAYIGDVLAFYLDQQFMEIRSTTARQLENVEAFAKMRGYKAKGKRAARCKVKWIVEVPANGDGKTPYLAAAPIIYAGSQAIGPNGAIFETLEDLDMSKTKNADGSNQLEWTASKFSDASGTQASYFALRREVDMVAGTTVAITSSIPTFQPFYKLDLGTPDVQEIIDVFDDAGNQWYEVDYLVQDVVFDEIVNTGVDAETVPYVLRFRAAPRRFVVDRSLSEGTTYLQFGNGEGTKNDDDLIPNVANMALPVMGRKTFTNFALDPQNFLKTKGLGLSPQAGSSLYIRFRVGGGSESNVDSYTINKAGTVNLYINPSALSSDDADKVRTSIEVLNLAASEGGGGEETIADIKANADGFFAAQMRAVTREDFLAHVMSMPARFGRPVKAYTNNTEFNKYAVDLHMLSAASDGSLAFASEALQKNVKTYLTKLRMMTEGINIVNTNIINIGVHFGIVISTKFNRAEVLTNCLNAVKNYLKTDSMQIGQPISLSDIRSEIQRIDGVISVYRFEITNMKGPAYTYSATYDIQANTANDIVYCPPDSIFEVKFPDSDIVGESK